MAFEKEKKKTYPYYILCFPSLSSLGNGLYISGPIELVLTCQENCDSPQIRLDTKKKQKKRTMTHGEIDYWPMGDSPNQDKIKKKKQKRRTLIHVKIDE